MASTTVGDLQKLMQNLHAERQAHVDAIAEIDAAFERFGVSAGRPKKRGRRPGRPKKSVFGVRPIAKKRRKRGTFKTTASELVLSAIKKAGAKGATGAQLSKAWKAAGRPGDAYNTLTFLTQAKKIKRHKITGERGSRYTVG